MAHIKIFPIGTEVLKTQKGGINENDRSYMSGKHTILKHTNVSTIIKYEKLGYTFEVFHSTHGEGWDAVEDEVGVLWRVVEYIKDLVLLEKYEDLAEIKKALDTEN